MGRARGFFDAVTSGSADERWASVERLVVDNEPESLWLDFKEVKPTAKPTEEYIKEKLARALSGFANTEGGVLVYGIAAKGGQKGQADLAERVVLIDAPRVFAAGVEKLASTLVDPVIRGVIVDAVEELETGRGVIIVYVPESLGGPHRVVGSTVSANDRYYMRTTTEHVVMPHRHLADRFARTASPRLKLIARVTSHDTGRVDLRLVNDGRGSARRPAVAIVGDLATTSLNVNFNSKLSNGFVFRTRPAPSGKFGLILEPHEDVVVYPGMSVVAGSFDVRGGASFKAPLAVTLHALDAQPVEGRLEIHIIRNVPAEMVNGREYEMVVHGEGSD